MATAAPAPDAPHRTPEPAPDLIIEARWVIPVIPRGAVLEHHAVAVRGGRVLAIEPAPAAAQRHPDCPRVRLEEHVLVPGLVNAHTHAAMSLLRGFADDLPLARWLEDHVWPAEARHVDARFVHDGAALAAAEMVRGGVTCFNDMYFFPGETAAAAAEAGMRACVGLIVLDVPTVWAADAEEYLAKAVRVHDACRDEPLITTAFAPHAPYTVSDGPLARVAVLAEELDVPVHMHVHETRDEVERSLAEHGARPLARLDRLGLVSPRLAAVHLTCVDDADLALLAARGAHAVHCPESNLKLASGLCPVERLRSAGINLAIGTDGAASNNDLDVIGEMRTAALLAKRSAWTPRSAPSSPARAPT